ncbi:hypothetical protein O6H91_15G017700 [Diphasiastrum complanatum]|uniref:Uncharacterized protein n=1 Tax=Diphasiastrum complanatum TaxID=34168 RepID=A0ACC2BGC9_DIPCM|nr:hypothetical protein O6H91_15G017700 [Diphasiastrum complanatum]
MGCQGKSADRNRSGSLGGHRQAEPSVDRASTGAGKVIYRQRGGSEARQISEPQDGARQPLGRRETQKKEETFRRQADTQHTEATSLRQGIEQPVAGQHALSISNLQGFLVNQSCKQILERATGRALAFLNQRSATRLQTTTCNVYSRQIHKQQFQAINWAFFLNLFVADRALKEKG